MLIKNILIYEGSEAGDKYMKGNPILYNYIFRFIGKMTNQIFLYFTH